MGRRRGGYGVIGLLVLGLLGGCQTAGGGGAGADVGGRAAAEPPPSPESLPYHAVLMNAVEDLDPGQPVQRGVDTDRITGSKFLHTTLEATLFVPWPSDAALPPPPRLCPNPIRWGAARSGLEDCAAGTWTRLSNGLSATVTAPLAGDGRWHVVLEPGERQTAPTLAGILVGVWFDVVAPGEAKFRELIGTVAKVVNTASFGAPREGRLYPCFKNGVAVLPPTRPDHLAICSEMLFSPMIAAHDKAEGKSLAAAATVHAVLRAAMRHAGDLDWINEPLIDHMVLRAAVNDSGLNIDAGLYHKHIASLFTFDPYVLTSDPFPLKETEEMKVFRQELIARAIADLPSLPRRIEALKRLTKAAEMESRRRKLLDETGGAEDPFAADPDDPFAARPDSDPFR